MLPRLSVSKIGPYRRTDAVDAFDLELRNLTYAKVVELGRVPAAAEVAAAAGRDPEEVVAGWRRLHDQHALVLNAATADIRMANPFSAVPTAYRVHAAGAGGTRTAPGMRSGSAVRSTSTARSRPPAPTAASRFRSRCAAGDRTTRACSSTASSPPPAGGTTSSSPEAR